MPAATLSAQLYSLRDRLAADRDATLLRLAGIGFGHVEPFGLGAPDRTRSERSASARALRSALDAAGLSVSAVHAALPRDAAELAEECAILGTATAFVPHPRLVDGFDEDTFADPGRVDALADVLATAAEALAPHGVRLGYHNHWFEWARLPDGTTGHDRFWSRAGDRLAAEVDLYWAAAGEPSRPRCCRTWATACSPCTSRTAPPSPGRRRHRSAAAPSTSSPCCANTAGSAGTWPRSTPPSWTPSTCSRSTPQRWWRPGCRAGEHRCGRGPPWLPAGWTRT
ncbi:sugar phosphate isomerase/epimerase family protein [Saccharopolyspora spinosporotrichia]